MKNIALIGMPATGKTSFGKQLAKNFNLDFIDIDKTIVKREQRSVFKIFLMEGEAYFRKVEKEVILETTKMTNTIISTGGGAALDDENIKNLKKTSAVVFIDKSPQEILAYFKGNEKRPLVKNKKAFYELYKERHGTYQAAADYTIKTNNTSRLFYLHVLENIVRVFYPDSLYGVIGDPITHSRSPQLYEKMGVDSYKRYWVKEKFFPDFMDAFKKSNLQGINVTAPYKEKIVSYLDEMSEDVSAIKASNTVIKKKNPANEGEVFLSGFNTDLEGLYQDLQKEGTSYKDKTIAIIGAGGAGKGIIYYAEKMGAKKIMVFARNPEKAEASLSFIKDKTIIEIYPFDELKNKISEADLVLQTTPLGMKYSQDYTDLSFFKNAKKDAFIYDIIYSPPVTNFLKEALRNKLKTKNGYDMLKKQARLSYKIFTG